VDERLSVVAEKVSAGGVVLVLVEAGVSVSVSVAEKEVEVMIATGWGTRRMRVRTEDEREVGGVPEEVLVVDEEDGRMSWDGGLGEEFDARRAA
jgi:hypothetical protein